jgi:hypothetical protein
LHATPTLESSRPRASALIALIVSVLLALATLPMLALPAAAGLIGPPSVPTNVVATTAAGSTGYGSNGYYAITVAWSPPASRGQSAITSYTATAQPSGATCTTNPFGASLQQLSCLLMGPQITPKTNDPAHDLSTWSAAQTITVTATNTQGTSAASSPAIWMSQDAVTAIGPTNAYFKYSLSNPGQGVAFTGGTSCGTSSSSNTPVDTVVSTTDLYILCGMGFNTTSSTTNFSTDTATSSDILDFNLATGAYKGDLSVPAGMLDVAWDGTHLWTRSISSLYEIDPTSGSVLHTTTIPSTSQPAGSYPGGNYQVSVPLLAASSGGVWTAIGSGTSVDEYSTSDGSVVRNVALPTGQGVIGSNAGEEACASATVGGACIPEEQGFKQMTDASSLWVMSRTTPAQISNTMKLNKISASSGAIQTFAQSTVSINGGTYGPEYVLNDGSHLWELVMAGGTGQQSLLEMSLTDASTVATLTPPTGVGATGFTFNPASGILSMEAPGAFGTQAVTPVWSVNTSTATPYAWQTFGGFNAYDGTDDNVGPWVNSSTSTTSWTPASLTGTEYPIVSHLSPASAPDAISSPVVATTGSYAVANCASAPPSSNFYTQVSFTDNTYGMQLLSLSVSNGTTSDTVAVTQDSGSGTSAWFTPSSSTWLGDIPCSLLGSSGTTQISIVPNTLVGAGASTTVPFTLPTQGGGGGGGGGGSPLNMVPGVAPTNVTVFPGSTYAWIEWTRAAQVPAYQGYEAYISSPAPTPPNAPVQCFAGNPGGFLPTSAPDVMRCELTGLTPGTSYQVGVNGVSIGGSTATLGAADPVSFSTGSTAPTGSGTPTATAGDGSMTLDWSGATFSGTTTYRGEAWDSNGNLVGTCTANDPATSCTITGLTNGATYTGYVLGADGTPTYTEALSAGTVTPATVSSPTTPGAPTNATAVASNGSATISWTPPSSTGGATITSYMVTASPGGATCTYTVTTPETDQCTISGLTNGTGYTFTVTAHNTAGDSSPSSASRSVTPSSGVSLAAPTLSLVMPGDQILVPHWSGVTVAHGTVLYFTATAFDLSGNVAGTCQTMSGSGKSCQIAGLTGRAAYQVTVTVTARIGTKATGYSIVTSAPSNQYGGVPLAPHTR